MKTLTYLFFLSLIIFSKSFAYSDMSQHSQDDFTVTKNAYWFSSDFDCRTGDQYPSKVSRTGWFNYYYDYHDIRNNHLARGITRTFSFTTVIDVYDHYGAKIGMIEGHFWTKARQKYVIYDERNNQKGIAYLHDENSSFLVVSPINDKVVLAELKRNSFGDVDYWEVNFKNGSVFDDRVIKIFGAFVSDYEVYFKPEPKHVHHYHNYQHQNPFDPYADPYGQWQDRR